MDAMVPKGSINPQLLDPNNYFLAFIREAQRVNLISTAELTGLQEQLMNLLKNQVSRYTGGDSTSVKVERAEILLLSLLYVLDARFLTYPQPEIAVAALIDTPLDEHYQTGIRIVLTQVKAAEALYREVLQTRIETELVAYNTTLDEAIPGFFAAYDPWYQAHDIPASIDYQLAWPVDEKRRGISYIYQYIQRLLLENEFCRLFPSREINRLLANYGHIYRIDYSEYLLNIFEIVFINAILAEILGTEGNRLNFPRETVQDLYRQFQGLSKSEVNARVYRAWEQMADRFGLSNQLLVSYVQEWLPQLLPRLHLALEQGTLERFFITDHKPVRASRLITLESGSALDDEDFRSLTERILGCFSAAEKVRLILSHVRSGADFYDILNAGCLYGEDYPVLFAALGDLELVMLITEVGAAEIREGILDLNQLIAGLTELDREWKVQLVKYLNTLRPEQVSRIENLLQADLQIID